jgi:hypothetical protein
MDLKFLGGCKADSKAILIEVDETIQKNSASRSRTKWHCTCHLKLSNGPKFLYGIFSMRGVKALINAMLATWLHTGSDSSLSRHCCLESFLVV